MGLSVGFVVVALLMTRMSTCCWAFEVGLGLVETWWAEAPGWWTVLGGVYLRVLGVRLWESVRLEGEGWGGSAGAGAKPERSKVHGRDGQRIASGLVRALIVWYEHDTT